MHKFALPLFFTFLLFALVPVRAQNNPTPATCGLPAEGSIVASVTYTLSADCTQTGGLAIGQGSSINLTINGNGHTIRAGGTTGFTILQSSADNTVTLSDVTFDGGGSANPNRAVMIASTGALIATRVTFRGGHNGVALNAADSSTAALTNVLFEENRSAGFGNALSVNSAGLLINTGATVTMTNAVVRNHWYGRGAIAMQGTGSLTTAGCLTFSGNVPYDVSRVVDNWTDNSSGPCSGAVGNGGSLVPPPGVLPCGLPGPGNLDASRSYTLRSDCDLSGIGEGLLWRISEGVTINIQGNGYSLVAGSGSVAGLLASAGNSSLNLHNLVLDHVQALVFGALDVNHVAFRNMPQRVFYLLGNARFSNSIFENITTTLTANNASVLMALSSYGDGSATFRDSVLRNIAGSGAPALNTFQNGTITLEGCITFENISPGNYAGNVTDNSVGPCGSGTIIGPLGPLDMDDAHSLPAKCFQRLGAIGIICRAEGDPDPGIEVWGISGDSVGFFLLRVNQRQIDAVPAGHVSGTADGRVAVRVWEDRNVTVLMGPSPEGKVHHVTFEGHIYGQVIGTIDTFGGPPGLDSAAAVAVAPAPRHALQVIPQASRTDGSIVHVVQVGETVAAIALAYGILPAGIVERNQLTDNGNLIFPGQELVIRDAA